MLCRVAESLFWMSRYIERSENTVRLVEVIFQTLIETENETDDIAFAKWLPILQSFGDLPLYEKLHQENSSRSVITFLVFESENLSSIFSAIAAARENARMIRDQISSDMWEIINRLYLFIKNTKKRDLDEIDLHSFLQKIKEYCQLYRGVMVSTYPRQIGYEFLQVGQFVERADKTARILDSKYYMSSQGNPEGAMSIAYWKAILKACSASEAHLHTYRSEVNNKNVSEFLMRSNKFPRSILFSLNETRMALKEINSFANKESDENSLVICEQLIVQLQEMKLSDNLEDTHHFLTKFCLSISELAIQLSKAYMLTEVTDPVEELHNQ